jgi:SAM-dependent methyltransferase
VSAEAEPSALLRAELDRVRAAAGRAPILDLACGLGRHALFAARAGSTVVALDRDRARLAALARAARTDHLRVRALCADLEAADTIPLASASCGAVLVFRYLHRPLAPELVRVLRPGGLLLYETFTVHHRDVAQHPRNPDFLLELGELPRLFAGLEILRAEEARAVAPEPEAIARLVARKPR